MINKKIVVVTGRSAAAAPLLKHSGHSKGHSKVDPKGDSKRAEAKIITKKVGTSPIIMLSKSFKSIGM